MAQEWFHDWFNSPYYHILYQQRDHAEAEFFIDNLLTFLKPQADDVLFDIACGRGRHAVYLNAKGFAVTGIDLSIASIQYAMQYNNERLRFFVHDMRYLFYHDYFDIALNLFTSFGYFKTNEEHIGSLKNFNKSLKLGGLLVLDFFNSEKIMGALCPHELKQVDGIGFNIHKKMENGCIIKTITFKDKGQPYRFTEEVKAFVMEDFADFFKTSGFELLHCFGGYDLTGYDRKLSDRMIFICKKTA